MNEGSAAIMMQRGKVLRREFEEINFRYEGDFMPT